MIRFIGFFELVFGALIFAKIVSWIAHPNTYPFGLYPAGIGGVIIMCLPAMVALVGLIELISNQPISEVEDSWSKLNSTKKFFLGTGVIIVSSILIVTVMSVFL
ncbi:MAG: hypothetical protein Q7T36_02645 [Fluviicoccus sp.]|uniref:hypothetical protein n=1 Tax=Fluviicoccus sp. TaxID=2003552 RepID=UPI00271C5FE9|nr:hypothetical protein [Fluviicoccus sp.]MDO8329352.1 hypothetical protein [Fluviicoccus sp.]